MWAAPFLSFFRKIFSESSRKRRARENSAPHILRFCEIRTGNEVRFPQAAPTAEIEFRIRPAPPAALDIRSASNPPI